ncbi:thiosulfate dehydrogenase [Chitinophaga niastensis]|uniref:Thiosulfate dehydrogenase n=1 Tax=Chitinophaga niastensis TaxID=536980 RepID=A0A2P8HGK5_CHINA|nr:c-type cytochrome [Chitinophaga niastensis]PSL45333.1 thiosulfate dehydrogenase [Chitinophaga niastensis]
MRSLIVISLIGIWGVVIISSCGSSVNGKTTTATVIPTESFITADTSLIPNDQFGEAVRYGRELMLNTAHYIGPDGTRGKYLGNKMNCTNCHQDAGTKAFSFNLMSSHDNYPQYRGREGKVLTLAERVNNCVMRPHNGKPLPLDSKEMVAFLSYFKWINSFAPKGKSFKGAKNLHVSFPAVAANPEHGQVLYQENCSRCHGHTGEGQWNADKTTYVYPPLWGSSAYQPGSSMHRVIKQAEWLKNNMPYDKVSPGKTFLTDAEALDIAAFVNNDKIHERPNPKSFDYPQLAEKAIDYDKGPFVDTFSVAQHKFGPYQPIISYWKEKGLKAIY